MVCDRCKTVVKTELVKLGLNPVSVELGKVKVSQRKLTPIQFGEIEGMLEKLGFKLLKDKKEQLTAQIKAIIIALVHYSTEPLKINFSAYLSRKMGLEYSTLSTIFSQVEQLTIEKYFILQKIERAKEFLTYGEKSLGEIALMLNYSSVAHLSTQFKNVTGQTTTEYKQTLARKTIDAI